MFYSKTFERYSKYLLCHCSLKYRWINLFFKTYVRIYHVKNVTMPSEGTFNLLTLSHSSLDPHVNQNEVPLDLTRSVFMLLTRQLQRTHLHRHTENVNVNDNTQILKSTILLVTKKTSGLDMDTSLKITNSLSLHSARIGLWSLLFSPSGPNHVFTTWRMQKAVLPWTTWCRQSSLTGDSWLLPSTHSLERGSAQRHSPVFTALCLGVGGGDRPDRRSELILCCSQCYTRQHK